MITNICITLEQFSRILSKLDCKVWVILVGINYIGSHNICFNELDNTVLFNKLIL